LRAYVESKAVLHYCNSVLCARLLGGIGHQCAGGSPRYLWYSVFADYIGYFGKDFACGLVHLFFDMNF